MSEEEPVMEGELVEVKAAPVAVASKPGEVRPKRPVSRALTWLGPMLAFVGREIVPRLATSLLDAWDRRADRSTPTAVQSTATRTVKRQAAGLALGGGYRRRRRQGRG